MNVAFRDADWTGCACHQFNLIVQDTLKAEDNDLPLRSVSEATKNLMRFMKKSK